MPNPLKYRKNLLPDRLAKPPNLRLQCGAKLKSSNDPSSTFKIRSSIAWEPNDLEKAVEKLAAKNEECVLKSVIARNNVAVVA
jgi:hypothetical protein